MSAPSFKLEFKLNGSWVDVSADTMGGFRCRRGIFASGPNDLVATPGQLTFRLANFAKGSRPLGYYALTSTNKRAYFDLGIRVRATLTVNSVATVIHTGWLDSAVPASGKWESLDVACVSTGWLGEAAIAKVSGIAVQVGKSETQLVSTLVTASAVQPDATDFPTGQDSYAYAFDSIAFGETFVLTELQRIAQAGRCYVFEKGNGTLVVHPRKVRVNTETNVDNFSDVVGGGIANVSVVPARQAILNSLRGTVHPREVASAATGVLMQFKNPIALGASVTYNVEGAFVDVSGTKGASRVGGTDLQALVAGTDYSMNSASDGSGTDLTASLSVSVSTAGNGARFTLTNTGSVAGYVTLLQVRGRAIYDFQTLDAIADADSTNKAQYGDRPMTLDFIYQSDVQLGQNIVLYYLGLYKTPTAQIVGASFNVPRAAGAQALGARLLALEISDRIGLTEQVTGITNTDPVSGGAVGHFVNGIEIVADNRNNMVITLALSPASSALAWKLAIAGRTELGGSGAAGTCLLGFGGLAA